MQEPYSHALKLNGGAALALVLVACIPQDEAVKPFDAAFLRLSPAEVTALPLAVRFDAPMGSEQGAMVYNAQPFRTSRHLGDDLNGIGGWNSDLGDTVYASGAGEVIYTGVPSDGWGNMVIVACRVPDTTSTSKFEVYQMIYAHLDTIRVKRGDHLQRGQVLGTVGTANGRYLAHLHFEIRKSHSIYPGVGYSSAALDRVSPEAFLKTFGPTSASAIVPAPTS